MIPQMPHMVLFAFLTHGTVTAFQFLPLALMLRRYRLRWNVHRLVSCVLGRSDRIQECSHAERSHCANKTQKEERSPPA